MRQKTRSELVILAEAMVDEFKISKIINSNEFLECALDLAERKEIDLNRQTLTKYEKELKMFCKSFSERDEILENFLEKKVEKKLIKTIYFYNDGTYAVEKPERQEEVHYEIPNYTMFAEGEDGYIVLKGTYKGKLVQEIDNLAWAGASKG